MFTNKTMRFPLFLKRGKGLFSDVVLKLFNFRLRFQLNEIIRNFNFGNFMKEVLYKLCQDAFKKAYAQSSLYQQSAEFKKIAPDKSLQILHAQRSRYWIESLAEILLVYVRENYVQEHEYSAFYRDNQENRKFLGLNEFLFDIVVAKMNEFITARDSQNAEPKFEKLKVIEQIVWLVESEFQLKNSKALLIDMNKLAVGRAKNKLFVMSLDIGGNINQWAEKMLSELTKGDDANIYLAKIPHPSSWEKMTSSDILILQIS